MLARKALRKAHHDFAGTGPRATVFLRICPRMQHVVILCGASACSGRKGPQLPLPQTPRLTPPPSIPRLLLELSSRGSRTLEPWNALPWTISMRCICPLSREVESKGGMIVVL